MDVRQLKTFLEVARLKSFTQAAQTLGYAQSTVTNQIQQLEQELDVKLFDRLGHSITLTQPGTRLLPYAEQVAKLLDEAGTAVKRSQAVEGTLSIGAVESLCVVRLPKLLKEYRQRYPNVELLLKFGCSADFLSALKENTIDIAFLLEKSQNQSELIVEIDKTEPLGLMVSPEHPLAECAQVNPQDLNGKTLILTEPGCSYRKLLENMLHTYGVVPHSVIETGNVQTIKQLTMSGMGVTLLPLIAAGQECEEGRLSLLNWQGPAFELHTQAVYHKNKWIAPPLRAFLELLREVGF